MSTTRTSQPLPPTNSTVVQTPIGQHPNAISQYNIILQFEKDSMSSPAKPELMHARILGYLLLNAPNDTAFAQICHELASCAGDHKKLSDLGAHYLHYYIRYFRKTNTRAPEHSEHPPRTSFEVLMNNLKQNLVEAPKSHETAKKWALIRDGYRCIVTEVWDDLALIHVPEEVQKAPVRPVHTECAHIIPEATYLNLSMGNKSNYSSSALTILKCFGYNTDNILGEKVHSLFNVMTLQKDMHDRFDRLEIWFEATQHPHRYKLKAMDPLMLLGLAQEITFMTQYESLPLPSGELLAIHAACCKVAHLSGAGEYIDKLYRDMEGMEVLSSDGNSAEVLVNALYGRLGALVDVGA